MKEYRSLLKVSLWSLIVLLIDVIIGLINQNIYATYLGNIGIVIIGNFQNILNLLLLVGSGGVLSGITRVIAEEKHTSKSIWAIITVLGTSVIVTLFCSANISNLYKIIIPTNAHIQQVDLILVSISTFVLSLPLFILSSSLQYVILGANKTSMYSSLRILHQIANLIITFALTSLFSLAGAIASMYLPQILMLPILYYVAQKYTGISLSKLISTISNFKTSYQEIISINKRLFKFAIVSFSSSSLLYISQLLVRNHISVNLSVEEASYWQVLQTISRLWQGLFLFIATVYLFPSVAKFRNKITLHRLLFNTLKFTFGIALIGSIVLLIIGKLLIMIIYGKPFMQASKYIVLQVSIDFFLIITMMFRYFALANEWIIKYIMFEVIYYIIFLIFAFLFTYQIKLTGVFVGQLVASIFYLLLYVIYYFYWLKSHKVN